MACDEHENSWCMRCCPCPPTSGAHRNQTLCNTHRAEVVSEIEGSLPADFWGSLIAGPYLDPPDYRPHVMITPAHGEQLPLW